MKRSLRILSGLALLALMFLVPVSAVKGSTVGSASCSWDAVADPSVSGYKVYWGIQSGVYDHSLDAGNVTQVIIPGFSPGVQYFSAVTAYSNTGGESDYSTEVSFSVSTAVVPATPVITTPPSAAAIVYGQTLASSTLSGGVASVPGSFTFTAPATAPAVGTVSQSVTFTPSDTLNYQTATTSASVTVSQATPLITTQPTASAIVYGQPLSSSILSGGASSVPGSFAFTTSGTAASAPGTLGGASFSWIAVPDASVSGYKLHWGTQSGVYGSSLDAGNVTQVIVSGFVEGVEYFSTVTAYSNTGEESDNSTEISFTVVPAGGTTIPAVGTASQSVTFTPTDTLDYQTVTTSVNITVAKATPVITAQPTATNLTYGQTLASSTLSGGAASVPGSFAFTTPATAPAAGTASQGVTFTPTDTADYQTTTATANVTVSKVTPLITTQPSATSIVYGQTLASSTLSGGAASVPGSFAFTAPPTAPAAGTTSQSVTFTPTDIANYQTVTTVVSVTATVSKTTPSITTLPTATAINYGQTLASSTLSGGAASVPGSFAFTTPAKVPAAGAALQSVTFTPTNTLTYQTVSVSVNVTVNNATVTLGKLAATYDGTSKAATATTNPTGLTVKLTYNGSATAPKSAGSYAVLATIVDATHTGSASGTLVIAKAVPAITKKPTAKAIVYGQTLASATLSGGAASVAGAFAFAMPTMVQPAGTLSQSVSFIPTDALDYQTVTTSVNVTVSKATPLITTKPSATAIHTGQTLASSTLSGGKASVPGAFAFTKPTTVPAAGTSSQGVTFTPTDTGDYLTAITTVSVTVSIAPLLAIAPESLESWRTRCFSPEQIAAGLAADDADPDGDGLSNLAEYALGTDPLVFTPPLTAVKNSDGLVLTFYRPSGLPDVLYGAESSDDLVHWNPCLVEMVADGPVQTMRAVDPLTSGNPARRFISLRFTQP